LSHEIGVFPGLFVPRRFLDLADFFVASAWRLGPWLSRQVVMIAKNVLSFPLQTDYFLFRCFSTLFNFVCAATKPLHLELVWCLCYDDVPIFVFHFGKG